MHAIHSHAATPEAFLDDEYLLLRKQKIKTPFGPGSRNDSIFTKWYIKRVFLIFLRALVWRVYSMLATLVVDSTKVTGCGYGSVTVRLRFGPVCDGAAMDGKHVSTCVTIEDILP